MLSRQNTADWVTGRGPGWRFLSGGALWRTITHTHTHNPVQPTFTSSVAWRRIWLRPRGQILEGVVDMSNLTAPSPSRFAAHLRSRMAFDSSETLPSAHPIPADKTLRRNGPHQVFVLPLTEVHPAESQPSETAPAGLHAVAADCMGLDGRRGADSHVDSPL
jgi:hypothetical protein